MEAIAALTDHQVGQLDEALNLKGAVDRDKWREQAKTFLGIADDAAEEPDGADPEAGTEGEQTDETGEPGQQQE
jgi:hypothetical protein